MLINLENLVLSWRKENNMKKLSKKADKPAKAPNIVLVSSFHSDEEEPWTYANRPSNRFVGHPMLDIRAAIATQAPMRWM